jgi:enoyl-[acyl-carrier protein] reductase III
MQPPSTAFLAGKTALVTGSGRGIGCAIALALAGHGCNIVVNYVRRRADAEATAQAIEALGVRALVIKAHVGDETALRALVEEATATLGGVDIFVANAASGVQRPVLELNTHAWDWTLNINARSILVGAQAVAPYMQARGWGRIIAISSLGSQRVYTDYAAVGVSKATVEALVRYLAVELAPHGIICNAINPGLVETEALDHFPRKDAMLAHARSNTPTGRLVTPADVSALALWLCSDAAAQIVGQTIQMDGGYSLVVGR